MKTIKKRDNNNNNKFIQLNNKYLTLEIFFWLQSKKNWKNMTKVGRYSKSKKPQTLIKHKIDESEINTIFFFFFFERVSFSNKESLLNILINIAVVVISSSLTRIQNK